MRLLIAVAVLAFAGLLLVACADNGEDAAPPADTASPMAAATVTATAGTTASCQAIQDIASYRYRMTMKLQSPAFQPMGDGESDGPLSEFGQALSEMFRDIELDGAFVAPDRSQVVLTFGEEKEEVELRVIGDRSWVRVQEQWQEESSSPLAEAAILSPESICANVVPGLGTALSRAPASEEIVNGIDTKHYHLDEADLKDLAELVGAASDTGELPEQFAVDVWLAKEGNWPVRMQIAASATQGGEPVSIQMFMEFRNINDPTIEIEPPEA